eukprot:TRINITY_DN6008_c0_g2_i1.p1 TRINITY_DN6008_c0_g2~~TRINITY_DN6008_c0_g2_i1.p1  ORF type:complete len:453 (+),score=19.13 TRINITY_DN6008_c0_g2_i1:64-1422(+)
MRWMPRGVLILSCVLVLSGLGLVAQRCADDARKDAFSSSFDYLLMDTVIQQDLWTSRNKNVPNARHVWWVSDIFVHSNRKVVLSFAHDYMSVGGNWTQLCRMDTNRDGRTNGEHLGDPCCRWQTSGADYSLDADQEYRRWHLSHPSDEPKHAIETHNSWILDSPLDCSQGYESQKYREDFIAFYFHNADGAHEDTEENGLYLLKVVCLLGILCVLGHWLFWKEMLTDMIPWAVRKKPVSLSGRIAVIVISFFYMDMSSGMIHLVLDYAPQNIPGLGILAKGFQYHHDDPTAIIRISWFEYASHIHVLYPLIQAAVVLSSASRLQRYFWFWGGVWAHLFQSAHRWAHMPPDSLPWIVRTLQSNGLLLSHERHMSHHEDLEKQFTILSGHTDFIVDCMSWVMPAERIDLWFLFAIFWFLLPILVDTSCRDAILGLQGVEAEADSRISKIDKSEV